MDKLTIGFLASIFIHKITNSILIGINNEIKKHNIELITLAGGSIHKVNNPWVDLSTNNIYNLATEKRFDGLIVFGGAIGQYANEKEMVDFCNKYSNLPIVNISLKLPKIPSVISSNYSGMYEVVSHLITFHKYKNIAFIKGPELHGEAEERFLGYKNALLDNGIELNKSLIFPGSFSEDSGTLAAKKIIKNYLNSVEAVVCADDITAFGAINEFQKEGYSIPEDIAVVGFDDAEIASCISPALTTVKQSFDQLGEQAVELLMKLINREVEKKYIELPSSAIIRESCGCIESTRNNNERNKIKNETKSIQISNIATIKEVIFKKYKDKLEIDKYNVDSLIDSIFTALKTRSELSLLKQFNRFIIKQIGIGKSFLDINSLLDYMCELIIKLQNNNSQELEIIIDQLRIRCYSAYLRDNILKKVKLENHHYSLNYINQILHKTISYKELFDKSFELFKLLEISSCYIVFFNDKSNINKGAKLVLAYQNYNRISIENGGIEFNPYEIIPSQIYNKESGDKIVVALTHNNENIGYIAFEIAPDKVELTHAICWHYSSAISRISILEEERRKSKDLQTALEELRLSQKKIIESEKYASLSNLASGIAHEINTPLGIGITYASLIEDDVNNLLKKIRLGKITKSNLINTLESIQTAAKGTVLNGKKAAKLIKSFKSLATNSISSDIKKFNLRDVIEDTCLTLESRLKRVRFRHKIHIDCPRELYIRSFPGSLNQVLICLIDNTIIHGFSDLVPGNVFIDVEERNKDIVITYIDDGSGVDNSTLNKLFEPFYTTKRNKGFVGLGLNTVFNIVTQVLKGTIEPIPVDKGFKIEIILPLSYSNIEISNF